MEVDARGKACPKPVLMTREALKKTEDRISVLVDNEAARENVRRFAEKNDCRVDVTETEFGFQLGITPKALPQQEGEEKTGLNKVLLITTDELGRGSDKLGKILMKAFLYSCTENPDIPKTIILMNSGVRLATENEETIEHLERLTELGSELLICGTCLEFFDLKDTLAVGSVSNMYEIQSTLIAADLLISV